MQIHVLQLLQDPQGQIWAHCQCGVAYDLWTTPQRAIEWFRTHIMALPENTLPVFKPGDEK